jgi:hypothetical protein
MNKVPRIRFAHLPTPIEELKRLSTELGGPRIYVKRDDATGLALGGNKTRKLSCARMNRVGRIVGHTLGIYHNKRPFPFSIESSERWIYH